MAALVNVSLDALAEFVYNYTLDRIFADKHLHSYFWGASLTLLMILITLLLLILLITGMVTYITCKKHGFNFDSILNRIGSLFHHYKYVPQKMTHNQSTLYKRARRDDYDTFSVDSME